VLLRARSAPRGREHSSSRTFSGPSKPSAGGGGAPDARSVRQAPVVLSLRGAWVVAPPEAAAGAAAGVLAAAKAGSGASSVGPSPLMLCCDSRGWTRAEDGASTHTPSEVPRCADAGAEAARGAAGTGLVLRAGPSCPSQRAMHVDGGVERWGDAGAATPAATPTGKSTP
jgi:hypothetical protein